MNTDLATEDSNTAPLAETTEKAWDYLRREITDERALRVLNKSVYGVAGLTDVADWYLWERLEASGLRWELVVSKINYLGAETRNIKSGGSTYQQTYYLVSAEGTLLIDGRPFPCVGAGENRRLDAAHKGAITSLFKNGCKWAGLTMSIYKGAAIDDDHFDAGEGNDFIQSRSAEVVNRSGPGSSENVDRAIATLDGKVINKPPATSSSKLTMGEFESNPINTVRALMLEKFNAALPRPNAEAWTGAMINLWLLKNEQDHLTDEMRKPESGGSPINWVFQLLVAAHYTQCGKNCQHIPDFHQQLINANVS